MIVPNLHGRFQPLRRLVERNPIATVHRELSALEGGVVADDHAVTGRIEFDDIERLGRGEAQALALADGIKFDALVMAEDLAVKIDNLTAVLLGQLRLLEEPAVVFVRHEANLHALLFVGRFELAVARHFAGVALGLFAKWKQGACQLLLPQRE